MRGYSQILDMFLRADYEMTCRLAKNKLERKADIVLELGRDALGGNARWRELHNVKYMNNNNVEIDGRRVLLLFTRSPLRTIYHYD